MVSISHLIKIVQVSDYSITTWLLLGAIFQCLLSSLLPRNIALLPSIIAFSFRFAKGYFIATGRLSNPLFSGVNFDRTTAQFPAANGTLTAPCSSNSIVVLVLSASFTHPNGRFCPGGDKMGLYFVNMWADAEAQREKYGYLGNTPAMVAEPDTIGAYGTRNGDDQGKTMVFLSYWRSFEGLQEFARGEAHMKGWLWWDRGAGEKFKHIGIMHETYEVPAGSWENISYNFRPFGIGKLTLHL